VDNRQIILKQRPRGLPGPECFELRRTPMPQPADGQVLLQNLYLSLDPAIRGWMDDAPSYLPPIEVGAVMRGTTVARVVESRVPRFNPGDLVHGLHGWEDYSIAEDSPFLFAIPPEIDRPLTNFLSVLGPTGLTAYFGMLEVAQALPGETVLVSGAAGAVGSIAGQIATMLGCRAVGIAGGKKKCRWLTESLGFAAAIDYKSTPDITAAIREACPKGVDVYFDNVGGEILEAVLDTINVRARIVMCGSVATYNNTAPTPGPRNLWQLLVKTASLEGYLVSSYLSEWPDARLTLAQWLEEGHIEFREHIDKGLESAPVSFLRLFSGDHDGKLIVDIAGES